jgi:hypothetical protein
MQEKVLPGSARLCGPEAAGSGWPFDLPVKFWQKWRYLEAEVNFPADLYWMGYRRAGHWN